MPITRPGRENETVVYRADIDGLRAVAGGRISSGFRASVLNQKFVAFQALVGKL